MVSCGFNLSGKICSSKCVFSSANRGEHINYFSCHHLPWEHKTFIFRGYNPYIGGLRPSFFMVLGSKGSFWNSQKKIGPFWNRKFAPDSDPLVGLGHLQTRVEYLHSSSWSLLLFFVGIGFFSVSKPKKYKYLSTSAGFLPIKVN